MTKREDGICKIYADFCGADSTMKLTDLTWLKKKIINSFHSLSLQLCESQTNKTLISQVFLIRARAETASNHIISHGTQYSLNQIYRAIGGRKNAQYMGETGHGKSGHGKYGYDCIMHDEIGPHI